MLGPSSNNIYCITICRLMKHSWTFILQPQQRKWPQMSSRLPICFTNKGLIFCFRLSVQIFVDVLDNITCIDKIETGWFFLLSSKKVSCLATTGNFHLQMSQVLQLLIFSWATLKMRHERELGTSAPFCLESAAFLESLVIWSAFQCNEHNAQPVIVAPFAMCHIEKGFKYTAKI